MFQSLILLLHIVYIFGRFYRFVTIINLYTNYMQKVRHLLLVTSTALSLFTSHLNAQESGVVVSENPTLVTSRNGNISTVKGKIVDEVEKGYWLNEKVIRYAKVVVGS